MANRVFISSVASASTLETKCQRPSHNPDLLFGTRSLLIESWTGTTARSLQGEGEGRLRPLFSVPLIVVTVF
jgi:hypothetical protein